ncbi:MAG TPA: glycosyltransferase family 2 protein [Opitutus sp.]|nr:glycosyltransferase family 2 protein [Opitutus sp.]
MACVLVMPAYNEEGCIGTVVAAWLAEFERNFGEGFRAVVVDDGSSDRTGEILDRLAAGERRLTVVHQQNIGHGGALRRGYTEALARGADRVFQVDSDDQFSPADFPRVWARRAESPCILGHRVARQDAPARLAITRVLQGVLFAFYGRRLKDANVPYRLIEAGFLRRALGLIPPGTFAPNIFIAVIAARAGVDLLNVPVTHAGRKTGRTVLVRWRLVRVCARCVGELWAFRGVLRRERLNAKAVQP